MTTLERNLDDEFTDKSELPDIDETEKEFTNPPIIGTRKFCNSCKTEGIELIDKNGITDCGFKTWKWAQKCDNCERSDCLEYLPIRLGDNVLETVNKALSEYRPKNKEQSQEAEIQKVESLEEWRNYQRNIKI